MKYTQPCQLWEKFIQINGEYITKDELARLYNIIHILNYHRPKIEDNTGPNIIIKIGDDNSNSSFQVSISNSFENNEIINFQKNINDAYDRNLKDFTDIIKLYFPESGLFR